MQETAAHQLTSSEIHWLRNLNHQSERQAEGHHRESNTSDREKLVIGGLVLKGLARIEDHTGIITYHITSDGKQALACVEHLSTLDLQAKSDKESATPTNGRPGQHKQEQRQPQVEKSENGKPSLSPDSAQKMLTVLEGIDRLTADARREVADRITEMIRGSLMLGVTHYNCEFFCDGAEYALTLCRLRELNLKPTKPQEAESLLDE